MVSMHSSSVIGHGFMHQFKPKPIKLAFAASLLRMQLLRSKIKDWLSRNQDYELVLPYIVTRLNMDDYCMLNKELSKSNKLSNCSIMETGFLYFCIVRLL